ncbi:class I SAM-dependent methyltransferase [Deinococcus sp.]|uniref:class I SAM-dependent methyltransferase n=1 Tax=Deinococcus sp. TaxID=47478 RepID=UPI003CC6245A
MTLAQRDALLSRLSGLNWPFGPLLDSVPVATGAAVLDVGGGDGRLLAELARRGHTGRRRLIDSANGTDAHRLPFLTESFEVVFLLRVVAHLHAPELALSEAWRVLKVGGRLIVAAHGPLHLAQVFGGASVQDSPTPKGAEPFDLRSPLTLSVQEQADLRASYGRGAQPEGNLKTELHLCGWTKQKGGRS